MTNAQTEARALWLAATREEICNDGDAISVIAAALAAKNAELAHRDMQLEASAKVALDLSAQLAEARKALAALVDLNDNHSPFGGELYQDRIDRTWDAARRALEAQGGENV